MDIYAQGWNKTKIVMAIGRMIWNIEIDLKNRTKDISTTGEIDFLGKFLRKWNIDLKWYLIQFDEASQFEYRYYLIILQAEQQVQPDQP